MRRSPRFPADLLALLVLAAALVAPGAACATSSLARIVQDERAGACASSNAADIDAGSLDGRLALAHLVRCQLEEGLFDEAVATWRRLGSVSELYPSLPWLEEIDGRIALLDGRADDAVARFSGLVARSSTGAVSLGARARRLYYLGLAWEAAGDAARAAEQYRELAHEYPASPYVSRAALALFDDELGARGQLDVALAALRGRHYDAAERLLYGAACHRGRTCSPREAVLSGSAARYEAAYQLGFMLYRYRREYVDRGLVWLATVGEAPGARRADALYYYASAVMRMERHEEARRAWRAFIAAAPDDPRVDEADYLLGWLYHDEDRHDLAVAGLQRYVDRHPAGARVQSAVRALAWSHYRLGEHREAIEAWRRIESQDNTWWRAQSRYWEAVSFDALGEVATAQEMWRDIIERWPLTWYALLSARRLDQPLLGPLGALPQPSAASATLPARYADVLSVASLGLAAESRLLAAEAGDGADLDDYTRDVLAMRTTADADDWRRWRWRFASVADSVPTDVAGLRGWRRLAPAFYADVVQSQARANELPPSLIWAIMQKESTYDPFALSESDAMGLMQVIPQTALSVSIRLGEHYVDGMLFEPWHAIRYGAWYLGALNDSFGGQLPLAIGAYNAGPVAMDSWVARNAGMPLDEFVEEIPYAQARDYIKRVITIMVGYEIAAADPARLASPTLGGLLPLRVEGISRHTVTF